jgi:uncharacterized protein YaiI (UPF0178 family)
MNQASSKFKIWVDADACPAVLRDILFRAAERLRLEIILVGNASLRLPRSELFRMVLVPSGADKADKKIVQLVKPGDLVITADIPLAADVVRKGGIALGMRGELFDQNSIGERLAIRNMLDQIRATGVDTGGPKPLNNKDVQAFANQLDRLLTSLTKE